MNESDWVALIALGYCVYIRRGSHSVEYVCLFNSSRDEYAFFTCCALCDDNKT